MNFKFDLDKEAQVLILTVSIDAKKTAGHPRIKVGWPTIKSLVDDYIQQNGDSAGLVQGCTVGECRNSVQGLDNAHPEKCSGVWIFKLVDPKAKQPKVVKTAVEWNPEPKKVTTTRSKKTTKKTKEG